MNEASGLWFHRTEVIIICIQHDALAGKARRLNKHLEIICVYLSLLFFAIRGGGGGGGVLLPCCHRQRLLITMASNYPNQSVKPLPPPGKRKSNYFQSCRATKPLSGRYDQKTTLPPMQRIDLPQAGVFSDSSPFPPYICLRHHSLGSGRHSLHQA